MVENLSYVLILCNSSKVPLLEKQIYIEDITMTKDGYYSWCNIQAILFCLIAKKSHC